MSGDNSVLREKRGAAFWITINRPDKRNAINGDVVSGIRRGYRSIARINGACLAAGMGLACMTDFAVAANHAVFGHL